MRVYHFVNEEHGILNLRKRRLKIANLQELNDPFELFGVELSNELVRRAFEVMKKELAEKRGILCFTERWNNPVMWSHYANRHAGLCLGFEVPDDCLGRVYYSRKRDVADLEKMANPAAMEIDEARKFLFTKYSHWKYEKEHRCFVTLEEKDPETELYFANFSSQLKLESVIVGARSTLSRADINVALGDIRAGIEVIKARLAFRSFAVVRQKNQKLWA